jgi:hypothetical protein
MKCAFFQRAERAVVRHDEQGSVTGDEKAVEDALDASGHLGKRLTAERTRSGIIYVQERRDLVIRFAV